MSNVEFTLDEMKNAVHEEIVAERLYSRQMLQEIKKDTLDQIKRVLETLEDKAQDENELLAKVEKHSVATQNLLKKHMLDTSVHGKA